MHRATRRHFAPLVAVFAVLLFGLLALAPVAGAWQIVSEHGGVNFDEASAVRGADGRLHIVYKDLGTGSVGGVRYRTMSAAGVLGAPETVVSGWDSVNNPDIELIGGVPHMFFSGLQNVDSSNPFNSGQAWTANRASGAWTISSTPMTQATTLYSSQQISSALDSSAQPWVSGSSTFGVYAHAGFATTGAEANHQPTNGCCGYGSNLATDAAGNVFLSYFSNATDQEGYWMRQVAPTLGAPTLLPRVGTDSLSREARMPMVRRSVGTGIYTAYCDKYPTCNGIRLAGIGRTPLRLALTDAQVPSAANSIWAAAAPAGRIWVTWINGSGLWVTRTNPALTKWEPVQKYALPKYADSPWRIAGEGSRGWLDVLAQVGTTSGADVEIRTHHQRVLPKLSLTAPLAVVHSNVTRRVALRLTDAGDGVVGTIRFRGVSKVTNSLGYATFTIPRATRTGTYVATGARVGYVANVAKVRVHFM